MVEYSVCPVSGSTYVWSRTNVFVPPVGIDVLPSVALRTSCCWPYTTVAFAS